MDTLLSHEATGEALWTTVNAGGSHDNDNMTDVVCPDYINTTHILTVSTYVYTLYKHTGL